MIVSAFFFFTFVFLFFTYTSFSQETSTQSNLEKLQITFPVNFTEKEKKFINSLPQTDLEKLIRAIKLIVDRNKVAQQSGQTQDLRGSATTYSNNPSPQTPYYNPSTKQYQSAPASSGGGSSGSGQSGSPGASNNNLPFSGQPTNGQQLPQPQSPAAALMQGLNQGLNPSSAPSTRQGSPSKCAGPNMKHWDAIKALNADGIQTPNTKTSFDGLPSGTITWLAGLKKKCNCNLSVNSATRSFGSTASARPNGHYVGNMVVDLSPDPGLNSFILKNGRPGGGRAGCSYTINGVVYESEIGSCVIGATQEQHWHVDARNWDCT